ncbi:DUF6233 domain-containing protein [Streptomyces sp. NPDC050704]|uniref:DUF6233 domain-containing protein n=1 Tax=Streptomyces sp. NPDC050704 TaxID=3157219 RepID=UPI00342E4848
MNDLPPDLPRLRTLETWLTLHLDQVRAAITAAEQQEREQHGGQARPAPPEWLIEPGLNRTAPLAVHVGGCWRAGKRSRGVTRDQALRAITEGVPACTHCRPDTELGIIDG